MTGTKTESIIKVHKRNKDSGDCNLGHACSFCPREESCTLDKPGHNKRLVEKRLDGLGMVLLVMANKGGVGKSTVSANLAVALANQGYQVGLADADIHGPNAPRIFGLQNERVKVAAEGIDTPAFQMPESDKSVKLGSLAFFLSETDTPVVWRDAYKHDYIHHMIGSFNWGILDFLVIDMPPGTGNELITLTDMLEGSNLRAVLVSSADAIALQDTLKAARFCQERGVPLLGLVENYAGTICPHCGEDIEMFPRSQEIERFERLNIPTLARIPFSREVAVGAESGIPASCDKHSSTSLLFEQLAEICRESAVKEARSALGSELSVILDQRDDIIGVDKEFHPELQKIVETEKKKLTRLKIENSKHERPGNHRKP